MHSNQEVILRMRVRGSLLASLTSGLKCSTQASHNFTSVLQVINPEIDSCGMASSVLAALSSLQAIDAEMETGLNE